MHHLPPLLPCLLALACTRPPSIDPDTALDDSDPSGPSDTQDSWDMAAGQVVYDPDRLHSVVIEVDPDDWDQLRYQQRNLLEILVGDCLEQPFDSPYTWFHADVTVDGERYADVGLRKKGLVGSNSTVKPSLKIRFDEYQDGQLHDLVDRLTLNNGQQDPAVISQCLGYELFRQAGVPASRCSFTTVEVNGEALGVFSNIEAMEPALLARWYDDPLGRLWEGQLSDFRDGWLGTFEVQEGDGDPAALEAVAAALEQPDDQLLEAIGQAVDLDQYLTFWAMEVLLGHWDGYAGNSNNYFVYQDPSDGRLDFMPWGIDALFDSTTPFGSTRPSSVVAVTALPRRLYLHQAGRDAYFARLQELLDTVWDVDAIQARVDAMASLVLPEADPSDGLGVAAAIDEIRSYVGWRRLTIESELDDGPPSWDEELRGNPCLVEVGTMGASFETTWGSYGTQDWRGYGSGSMDFSLDGTDYEIELLGALAGMPHDEATLLVVGQVEWGGLLAMLVTFPEEQLVDGSSSTVDWSQGQAYLYYDETGTGTAFAVAGYLGNGPMVFEQAGASAGDRVRGSLDLNVYGGQ